MTDDLPIAIHDDGTVRKLGCTVPSDSDLRAAKTRFSQVPPQYALSDADFNRIISDPSRVSRRVSLNEDNFPGFMAKSDQKSIGSCQCWTCADSATILHRELKGREGTIFAGQPLYAYLRPNHDDVGTALIDGLHAMIDHGIGITVDDAPNANDFTQATNVPLFSKAARVKAVESSVFQLNSFQEALWIVAQRGIVNLAVEVNDAWMNHDGVTPMPVIRGAGNHSVVGMDVIMINGQPYLHCKQHWGSGAHDHGFFIVGPGSIQQTLPVHGMWGILQLTEEE